MHFFWSKSLGVNDDDDDAMVVINMDVGVDDD